MLQKADIGAVKIIHHHACDLAGIGLLNFKRARKRIGRWKMALLYRTQ